MTTIIKTNTIIIFVLLLIAQSALKMSAQKRVCGALASQQLFSYENPDKTTLEIRLKGDGLNHWYETVDGYSLIKTNGYFHYLQAENGKIKTSGILAHNAEQRNEDEIIFLSKQEKHLIPPQKEVSVHSSKVVGTVPSVGEINIPVILIDYANKAHVRSKVDVEAMFKNVAYNGNLGFTEWFKQSSHDKLKLNFDVFGWYTSSDNMAVFADDAGMYKTGMLVKEAVEFANEAGADFSKYDNNSDGAVDVVIVMHAGDGAEQYGNGNYIWAHSWSISGTGYTAPTFDGVKVDAYNVGCETRGSSSNYANIGMYCHEFGHAMGLPDLYDGSWKSNGLGHWCMMSAGSWLDDEKNPGVFSAWCRIQLGWEDAMVLNYDEEGTFNLESSNSNPNQIYRINTTDANEYFLLTNRQNDGVEVAQPGTGLAIFHINHQKAQSGSNVNNDRDNAGVRLMEADFNPNKGLYNAKDRGSAGDLFPGFTNTVEFNPLSVPNSNLYNGKVSGVIISEIEENNQQVSFAMNKQGYLMVDGKTFFESNENDGTIQNKIDFSLLNGSFVQESGLLDNSYFVVENLPEGLKLQIELNSVSEGIIKLEGKADHHTQSISNISLSFLADAFLNSNTIPILGADVDDLEIIFKSEHSEGLLFFEDFELTEIGNLPAGWVQSEASEGVEFTVQSGLTVHNEDDGDWESTAFEGVRSLSCSENWGNNGPVDVFVATPVIDLQNQETATLSFENLVGWDNYWPSSQPTHVMHIIISDDNENWNPLIILTDNEDDFKNWTSKSVSLNDYCGKKIRIGFQVSTHHYYWRLDNVSVSTATAIKKHSSNFDGLSVYPNPFSSLFNVESVQPGVIQKIQLFSLQGQLIFETIKNRNISISDLNHGFYVLKIHMGNHIISKQIIKTN